MTDKEIKLAKREYASEIIKAHTICREAVAKAYLDYSKARRKAKEIYKEKLYSQKEE